MIGARRYLSYAVAGSLGGVSALLLSFSIVQWLSFRQVVSHAIATQEPEPTRVLEKIPVAAEVSSSVVPITESMASPVVAVQDTKPGCSIKAIPSAVLGSYLVHYLDEKSLFRLLVTDRIFHKCQLIFLQQWYRIIYGSVSLGITQELLASRKRGEWDKLPYTATTIPYDFTRTGRYNLDIDYNGAVAVTYSTDTAYKTRLYEGNSLRESELVTEGARGVFPRIRIWDRYICVRQREVFIVYRRDAGLTQITEIRGDLPSGIFYCQGSHITWVANSHLIHFSLETQKREVVDLPSLSLQGVYYNYEHLCILRGRYEEKTFLLAYDRHQKTVTELEQICEETHIYTEGNLLFRRVGNIMAVMDLNEKPLRFTRRFNFAKHFAKHFGGSRWRVAACAIRQGWVAYILQDWPEKLQLYHWKSGRNREQIDLPFQGSRIFFVRHGIAVQGGTRTAGFQVHTIKFR